MYKKDSRLEEKNYCPISILPNLSEICEIMHSQISAYVDKILFKYQFGFRQGYSSQQCLLMLIEKWKKSLDKEVKCGALLTDLSKAFDCLLHNFLIAKFHAYGVEIELLRIIYSYLEGKKQRVKNDNEYSIWQEILFRVPQGSILGPLLFNIHLCDLFFVAESIGIASYADNTTSYVCLEDMDLIIEGLKFRPMTFFNGLMKMQ